jgi:hypothetical protein
MISVGSALIYKIQHGLAELFDQQRGRRGRHDSMDAGGRATHDHREVGGRVTPGAVTEEAKAEDPEDAGFHKYPVGGHYMGRLLLDYLFQT